MGISQTPSVVTLPAAEKPYPDILDFLASAFPHVSRQRWAQRLRDGKLRDDRGRCIDVDTPYAAGLRIFYFREVDHEPQIPFAETILFQNDELLVADKPHFLPVVPGGRYVNECLLNRLRERTGLADLAPLHRLDRETAGLVLFSVNPETRGRYHALFAHGEVEKTYEALCEVTERPTQTRWRVENRIVRGEPRFRMQIVPGAVNARSEIELLEVHDTRAHFRLLPLTGKTHQLRLHLSHLGFPIVNDRVYPVLQPQRDDDYAQPLQLLARGLRFRDPISGADRAFQSAHALAG